MMKSFAARMADLNSANPRPMPEAYMPEFVETDELLTVVENIGGKRLEASAAKPLSSGVIQKLRYAAWQSREIWRIRLGLPA